MGKTTLLYQLAADVLARGEFHPRRILYVSFDHPIAKLARLDQVARLFADVAGLLEIDATASPAALWLAPVLALGFEAVDLLLQPALLIGEFTEAIQEGVGPGPSQWSR